MSELMSLNLDKLQNPTPSIIDRKTLMKEYGIGKDTLWKWMYKMDLKFYKIGNKKNSMVYFKREDLNNWLETFRM